VSDAFDFDGSFEHNGEDYSFEVGFQPCDHEDCEGARTLRKLQRIAMSGEPDVFGRAEAIEVLSVFQTMAAHLARQSLQLYAFQLAERN
jgi:hypothetical protein